MQSEVTRYDIFHPTMFARHYAAQPAGAMSRRDMATRHTDYEVLYANKNIAYDLPCLLQAFLAMTCTAETTHNPSTAHSCFGFHQTICKWSPTAPTRVTLPRPLREGESAISNKESAETSQKVLYVCLHIRFDEHRGTVDPQKRRCGGYGNDLRSSAINCTAQWRSTVIPGSWCGIIFPTVTQLPPS